MKKKMINETKIVGYLYDHELNLKVSGENSKKPGTTFINGDLMIATDKEGLNVIKIHYSYVTETTNKGGTNNTFLVLKNIIDGKYKSIAAGDENPTVLKADSAIELIDFPDPQDETKWISAKKNEAGFIKTITENELPDNEQERATFTTDIVITKFTRKEADEEKNLPEKGIVKGYVFNFRKAVLPVEFSVLNPKAIDYFEGLDISGKNPIFTKVWGQQVSQTVIKKKVEQNAFGEDFVTETKNSYKDYVITGASKEPYDFDTEDSILATELQEALTQREIYLASEKQRREEYQKQKQQQQIKQNMVVNDNGKPVYNF